MEKTLTYSQAIEEAGQSLIRFPLKNVRGVPLMEPIAQNFEPIWAFCPDPTDILIATYPKAGTTWTQEIVDLLLHNGDTEACKRGPIVMRSPFLEIVNPLRSLLVIYVARNAKDNMVSYYHFDRMNLTQPEPGTWESYIQKFMKGELAWGSWYDHVKGYWEEREKRNILYLFYEDMKENLQREVERIKQYLDLSVTDDVIARIVAHTSFEVMKENPMANYSFIPKNVFDDSISAFMRKGEVGDWVNHFSESQLEIFNEDYQQQMKMVKIPFRENL